ncbi:MAG: MoxR family ATPase [Acidimicrobiia bacterium]|nr:MoxR family ATPase [Acidimicrobiia bacterium]
MTQTDNVAAFTRARIDSIRGNVERVLQGKQDAIRLCLVALLAGGHVLIEDVPGVGKTLLARSLAESLGCQWRRVQFTPDLLPADLVGVNMWDPDVREFTFHPGPVFANVLLADEVNRASPKTQSALLECMEEAQVTVDATTFPLAKPFLVIATQNPFEHEGTYPLPESQLDRFLVRVAMGYPSRDAALRMLEVHTDGAEDHHHIGPVSNPADVIALAEIADACYVAPPIKEYVLDIGDATRADPEVALGVSPRGCVHLIRAAKAAATLAGRNYVVPDDIKWLAGPVLEHRLALVPEAQIRGARAGDVLARVLESVPVTTGR